MENIHLLIVDPQNDFCNPRGNLYIPGADDDMSRLADFIHRWKDQISQIHVTLDTKLFPKLISSQRLIKKTFPK